MSKPPAVAQRKSQQMRGNRKARPAALAVVAEPTPEHSVHAPPAAGAASGLGKLVLKGKEFEITDHDLERREHLGSGTYGEVCKVVHKITGTVMAVKVSEPCSMPSLDLVSATLRKLCARHGHQSRASHREPCSMSSLDLVSPTL